MHDVLDCQYRHKFADSNAWTALTGIPPKELHWPLCIGWTMGWCGTLPMPVSIQSYGCCPVVVDWSLIKCLITVGRELRQHQHDSNELCSWDVPPLCRNSRLTVINLDYNMTKQRYITGIYDVTSHIVTSHISPLRREFWLYTSHREGSECARNIVRHVKLCGQLMQVEWFVAIKIIYMESSITINISQSVFVM